MKGGKGGGREEEENAGRSEGWNEGSVLTVIRGELTIHAEHRVKEVISV